MHGCSFTFYHISKMEPMAISYLKIFMATTSMKLYPGVCYPNIYLLNPERPYLIYCLAWVLYQIIITPGTGCAHLHLGQIFLQVQDNEHSPSCHLFYSSTPFQLRLIYACAK